MTTTANSLPGTVTTASSGFGLTWTNPNNIKLADVTYATSQTNDEGDTSDYLISTNFGFSVPTGATISRVKVTANGYTDRSFDGDPANILCGIQLYNSVVIGDSQFGSISDSGTGAADTIFDLPTTATGLNPQWGVALTPAIVNSSNFGVRFYIGLDGGADSSPITSYVDYIKVQLTYTLGGASASNTILLQGK